MIFVWVKKFFVWLLCRYEEIDFESQCPSCGHRTKSDHTFTMPMPENKLSKPAVKLQCASCAYAWYVPTISECR